MRHSQQQSETLSCPDPVKHAAYRCALLSRLFTNSKQQAMKDYQQHSHSPPCQKRLEAAQERAGW